MKKLSFQQPLSLGLLVDFTYGTVGKWYLVLSITVGSLSIVCTMLIPGLLSITVCPILIPIEPLLMVMLRTTVRPGCRISLSSFITPLLAAPWLIRPMVQLVNVKGPIFCKGEGCKHDVFMSYEACLPYL